MSSCNYGVSFSPPRANATPLIVDSGATEGCVDAVLLPVVCKQFVDYTILGPLKRLIRIGNSIVEADAKRKMAVILTDANGSKLNVLIPMPVAPGMGYHVYSVGDASTRGV